MYKPPKHPAIQNGDVVRVHMDSHTLRDTILLSHKNEGGLVIGSNMDGPRGHYVKWNKSDRERQIPYDFTHVESNQQTELTGKTETDS